MRSTEIEAAGTLAGDALAAGGALVEQMHAGIASRPFGLLGPAAAPVRVLHDGIAGAVYAGVRGGLKVAARGGAHVLARRADPDAEPLESAPRAVLALAALNGLYGDRMAERDSPLALRMDLRRGGRPVAARPDALAAAFPAASPRLAVFVHGLGETEEAWRLLPRRDAPGRPTYGERLAADLGFTPLDVRYNTGLRISRNGRDLARLLEDVVAAWPVAVEEVTLVGHSMGGLVARSACHYAHADELLWAESVRHVFCLGSPHLGADLEKGVNALAWALGRLPETRAIGALLNTRSVGIKDLRFGSCVEEDWSDCDPDEFLRDRCTEVPFLPGAAYYFIGATLSPDPVGRLLGDLLVRLPSASGAGGRRRVPFDAGNGRHLPGLTHFDLLNHPAVYEQMREWIGRGRASER